MKSIKKSASRRLGAENRWTLLFIGDHGRVITLKRFKAMVLAAVSVFVLLLVAFSVFVVAYQHLSRRYDAMKTEMLTTQKQIRDLRHEKDILMARVVVAESKLAPAASAVPEPTAATAPLLKAELPSEAQVEPAAEVQPQSDGKTSLDAGRQHQETDASESADEEAADGDASAQKVAVEDFSASRTDSGRRVKISFRVKNVGQRGQRISGHAIVVLQNDRLNPSRWQSIPAVGLTGGKPTGQQRGKAFAIRFFRTMTYEAQLADPSMSFDSASVYVYGSSGEALLEEDFAVSLPSSSKAETKTSSPAVSADELKKLVETAPAEVGVY